MRKGFTLAEVLITLGIIGVVSALTIPALIADYNAKSWNTSAKVFEKKLEQALKVMNTQQVLANHDTTLSFVEELSNHFKINKICKDNNMSSCFPEEIIWDVIDITQDVPTDIVNTTTVTESKDLGHAAWGTEAIGVQFASGVSAIVAYNPDCVQDPYTNEVVGTSCIAMMYDVSGYKSPNSVGKDLRGINAGFEECYFKISGKCFTSAFSPKYMTPAQCAEKKDALGIPDCWTGNDYWAGAIEQCGGIDNLPTKEQLVLISKYLYDGKLSGAYCPKDSNGNYTNCRNNEKLATLGINVGPTEVFRLWSNEQYNNYRSWSRHYHPDRSTQGYDNRPHNTWFAICSVN